MIKLPITIIIERFSETLQSVRVDFQCDCTSIGGVGVDENTTNLSNNKNIGDMVTLLLDEHDEKCPHNKKDD